MNNYEEKSLWAYEAEQTVIGAILINNDSIDECQDIDANMFSERNKHVYRALKQLSIDNMPIDVITLNEALEESGLSDMVGGLAYLVDIQQNTPSHKNIKAYVKIVYDRYKTRGMVKLADDISELVYQNDGMTIDDKLAEINKMTSTLIELAADSHNEKSYSEAAGELLDHMQKVMDLEDGELLGLSTGVEELDRVTYGLERGRLAVIGGRPSMGKSVLAENIARHASKKGLAIRFHSYEMPSRDIIARGAAAEHGINLGDIKCGKLHRDDYDNLSMFVASTTTKNWVFDEDIIGVDKIAARARAQKRKTGLDMLVIDHLHLMPLYSDNETKEYGHITRTLKLLARELDIVVVLVAQLSREVEKRHDKRPMMSDVRASGGIEQDADYIVFPFRPAYYNKDLDQRAAILIVAKNRDGERQDIPVNFEGQYQRFTNSDTDWTAPMDTVEHYNFAS